MSSSTINVLLMFNIIKTIETTYVLKIKVLIYISVNEITETY
jgi:hypothetical protein